MLPIYTDKNDPRTYAIIGASMAVHGELGCGFLEPIYQEALALEFTERDIPFVRELQLSLAYKRKTLKTRYSPDFICYESVVVEFKALNRVGGIEQARR